MDRLNAMRVFVTVVDLGSQSAAADHLELSRPVVSRYLAELEDWVGARLMQRTTRKLSLTAGQETCRAAGNCWNWPATCRPPCSSRMMPRAAHCASASAPRSARPSWWMRWRRTSSATPG
jgi:hypothetical protein